MKYTTVLMLVLAIAPATLVAQRTAPWSPWGGQSTASQPNHPARAAGWATGNYNGFGGGYSAGPPHYEGWGYGLNYYQGFSYFGYNLPTGIQFDLSNLSGSDRKLVEKKGVVFVHEGNRWIEVGAVKNFKGGFFHKMAIGPGMLLINPGTYDISISCPKGKEFRTTAGVQLGVVTHILVRLDDGPAN